MMYNLRAIQIFVVVAETCSFRKAAELLNRSQSAVGAQIRLLEEQIRRFAAPSHYAPGAIDG